MACPVKPHNQRWLCVWCAASEWEHVLTTKLNFINKSSEWFDGWDSTEHFDDQDSTDQFGDQDSTDQFGDQDSTDQFGDQDSTDQFGDQDSTEEYLQWFAR